MTMQRVLKGNRFITEVTSTNVHISSGSTTRTVWNHNIYSDLDLEYEIHIAFTIVTLRCQLLGSLAGPGLSKTLVDYGICCVLGCQTTTNESFTTTSPQVITRLLAVVGESLVQSRENITHTRSRQPWMRNIFPSAARCSRRTLNPRDDRQAPKSKPSI